MAYPPATEETTRPPSMASSQTVSARSLKTASARAASIRSTRHKLRLRHKKSPGLFGSSGLAKKTLIKDLRTEEERILAERYDLNRDGALDEAEMAMMNYDVDGDGNLTLVEIHT